MALAFCLLFAFLALWVATQNLTRIARWAIHHALPAAKIELHNVRYEAPARIIFEDFRLQDRKSHLDVLRLDGGSVVFSFNDLWRAQLGEIRLVNPVVLITPGLTAIISPSPGNQQAARPWTIRRIVCDYGEIWYDGFGDHSPSVRLKCAFDLQNFSTDAPLDFALWDVQATAPGFSQPFLVLDLVNLQTSFEEIAHTRKIATAKITGGQLLIGSALEQILEGPPTSVPSDNSVAEWVLQNLTIQGLGVRLDDGRPEITDIAFQLNTTLHDLSLLQTAGALGNVAQMVEITDFEVVSPLDPLTKVISMRSVFLHFTLAGLLKHEFDKITILYPTIYVSEDLFWYMDAAQKHSDEQKSESSPPWKIHLLDIKFGRLVLGSGGRTKYGLPLNFQTTAQDVSLNNLATLKMQIAFEIPSQNYSFPSYQLEFSTQKGDLQFAYPPSKGENNLVGTVKLNRILWRQYQATEAWISTTFDRNGINGDFGGRVYSGYISGGFSFFFNATSPWIGWIAGKQVDLRQLTDVIAPQNFSLSGPLDFKLQMNAFGKEIERVKADFKTTQAGHMKIGKLDDFLSNIPSTWNGLKQSSTRIALETLRDFDYTKAEGDFWIVRQQGILTLKLRGPLGSRNFEIVLHSDESPEGKWKEKNSKSP